MPRPPSNIDQFREQIIQLHADGTPFGKILESLRSQGLECSERTLKRRVKEWNLKRRALSSEIHTKSVKDYIKYLFHQKRLTDSEIHEDLRARGSSMSVYMVKSIRLDNNMKNRHRCAADREQTARQAAEWMDRPPPPPPVWPIPQNPVEPDPPASPATDTTADIPKLLHKASVAGRALSEASDKSIGVLRQKLLSEARKLVRALERQEEQTEAEQETENAVNNKRPREEDEAGPRVDRAPHRSPQSLSNTASDQPAFLLALGRRG